MTSPSVGARVTAIVFVAVAASAQPGPSAPAQPGRASAPTASRPPKVYLGDHGDGSRARPVHRIPLRDGEGEVIRPTDTPLLPFSPVHTCGADCHDVGTVTKGWHFRTGVPGAPGGRRGEPWILVDHQTATVLPLSNHDWPGTFRPGRVGITPWQFARLFGGRVPGGLSGATEPGSGLRVRWMVAGDLDPDCLACHDASPAYDRAEYGRQVGLENFRWAAAAASGFAQVTGAAREMPPTYDYLLPSVEDDLRPRMPSVTYATTRLLPDSQVVFDIEREVPARRCYFCHSTVDVAHTGAGRWQADADLHVARGMTCVDCHRNGLDHAMTRGYEGDPAAGGPGATAVTCRGCHMANEASRVFASGRLAAPSPRHEGLPPIHLEKLSCTACHAGPMPAAETRRFKTSLAHRLGGLNVNKSGEALPHLQYPVFATETDGTITPNRLVWPAYWAAMRGDDVQPLPVDRVKAAMGKARIALRASPDGTWPSLDEATLARVLGAVQAELRDGGTAVYVAGGALHRLDAGGAVTRAEHAAAQPYLWPIAHDVRPAALALGARGCQDCHDESAPLFFGRVAVDSPLVSDGAGSWQMARFQKGIDTATVTAFARTFSYRPWMKGALASAASLVALFVAAHIAIAMRRLSAATSAARWTRVAANVVAIGACATSVYTGWPALRSGAPLTGDRLMLHVGAAPAFVVGALLAMLFWAHRNRFGRSDWHRVTRPIGAAATHQATPYLALGRKVSFWIAATALVPAVTAAALALFPVLASAWQPVLFQVHRYAVGVMLTSAGLCIACAVVAWIRRYPDVAAAPACDVDA